MNGVLVDSNVILDVFEADPQWVAWSEGMLQDYSLISTLYINAIIYAEISIGFLKIEEVEAAVLGCGFEMLSMPKEALFLAGKAFIHYRKRKGNKTNPLPDFYIGAHAAVMDLKLLTRDTKRIKSYFPSVRLICP